MNKTSYRDDILAQGNYSSNRTIAMYLLFSETVKLEQAQQPQVTEDIITDELKWNSNLFIFTALKEKCKQLKTVMLLFTAFC